MKIQHILNTKGRYVVTVRPQQSLREALSTLVRHDIGALVVVNECGHPIGILSERDIIQAASVYESIFSLAVGALMVKEIIVGEPDADLEAIAHTMTELRTRHVAVMDQGHLVGMVSIGDIVKAQRDAYQGSLYTLEAMVLEDTLGG